jgi:hypothetical protein
MTYRHMRLAHQLETLSLLIDATLYKRRNLHSPDALTRGRELSPMSDMCEDQAKRPGNVYIANKRGGALPRTL